MPFFIGELAMLCCSTLRYTLRWVALFGMGLIKRWPDTLALRTPCQTGKQKPGFGGER